MMLDDQDTDRVGQTAEVDAVRKPLHAAAPNIFLNAGKSARIIDDPRNGGIHRIQEIRTKARHPPIVEGGGFDDLGFRLGVPRYLH